MAYHPNHGWAVGLAFGNAGLGLGEPIPGEGDRACLIVPSLIDGGVISPQGSDAVQGLLGRVLGVLF